MLVYHEHGGNSGDNGTGRNELWFVVWFAVAIGAIVLMPIMIEILG